MKTSWGFSIKIKRWINSALFTDFLCQFKLFGWSGQFFLYFSFPPSLVRAVLFRLLVMWNWTKRTPACRSCVDLLATVSLLPPMSLRAVISQTKKPQEPKSRLKFLEWNKNTRTNNTRTLEKGKRTRTLVRKNKTRKQKLLKFEVIKKHY